MSESSAAERDLPFRTGECFFQRHHDVGLDVLAALGRHRSPAKTGAPAKSRFAATAAKKLLEEIAEPGAAKFKLHAFAVAAAVALKSATTAAASRRRRETARLIPIRAELIVLGAFFRIAQDLVGLVDLLEFLLRGGLLLRLHDVGMMNARELPERAFDLRGVGRFRDA